MRNLSLSILVYIALICYFPNNKLLWGIPFMFFNYKYVILKEEFVHMRSHWPTKMTGSEAVDTTIGMFVVSDYDMLCCRCGCCSCSSSWG